MAVIANCIDPVTISSTFLVGGTIRNAVFPVPPTAWGFATDLDFEFGYPWFTATPPYFIISALNPESDYLEPTIGQVWPRIG